jgi:hypothetical protein
MKAGRSEALDVVRKWLSERALLQCNLDVKRIAATFRARVRAISDDRITLLSDDTTSELILVLAPHSEFAYVEPDRSAGDVKSAVAGLVIFLSPTGPGSDPDVVTFTELVEE